MNRDFFYGLLFGSMWGMTLMLILHKLAASLAK